MLIDPIKIAQFWNKVRVKAAECSVEWHLAETEQTNGSQNTFF